MMPSRVPEDEVSDTEIELLGPFILAYDEAIEAGRTPPVLNDSTLSPGMRARLRKSLTCVNLLAQGRRHGSANANSAALQQPEEVPLQIGRFDIIGELGRGGFGIVFLARDTLLGREVALKMPRPEVLVTVDLQQRFIREAQAAASLEHPNIVAVYEVGEDGPLCYIASAVCRGPTLNAWRKSQSAPARLGLAAEWVAQLADGVAHAHQRGVLHRDIKPSNVLLDPLEKTSYSMSELGFIPRLTDFGLAKSVETHDELTRTGALLGTPAYMSPEQAEGRTQDISVAVDIYGLGVILYELVTGRVPFVGNSDVDTLRRVAIGEIARPRRHRPETPPDLEAIILKCLQRSPADRYESAAALAADLRRFLTGMPTLARPLPVTERLWNWVYRKPAVAALLAVSAIASLSLGVGGWWYSAELRSALLQTQQRQLEVRHQLYSSDLNGAWRALESNHLEEAVKLLEGQIPQPGEPDLREFTWKHLWHRTHEEFLAIAGHQGEIYSVQFSPDGKSLVTASQDRTACVWDALTGRRQLLLEGHTRDVNCATFSPSGDQIASASDDGHVRIWNRSHGTLVANWVAHEKGANQVLYVSPDLLVSCGQDSIIRLWNPANGSLIAQLIGHENDVECLAIAPGGAMLASGSVGEVKLWHLPSCEQICTLRVDPSPVSCLALSADGSRLLVGSKRDRNVVIWSISQQKKLTDVSKHYAWVHAVAWIHDEQEIVVATKEGELKSVDAATGIPTHTFNGHRDRVWSVAVSPNGQYMASAGAEKVVKVWSLTENVSHMILESDESLNSMSAKGNTLVAAGSSGRFWVWDLITSPASLALREIVELRTSSSARLADDKSSNGLTESSTSVKLPEVIAHSIRCLALSANGDQVAACAEDNSLITFFRLADGQHKHRQSSSALQSQATAAAIASNPSFYRDGAGNTHYVVPRLSPTVVLQSIDSRPHEQQCYGLTFSPSSRLLASSDMLGQITVWGAQSGTNMQTIRAHSPGETEVAFAPRGDVLASSGDDGSVKIWSTQTWQCLQTLVHEQQGELQDMTFSRDGKLLATGGSNRVICVWDVASGKRVATLTGHSSKAIGLALSPDNRTLASIGADNTVRLWDFSTKRDLVTLRYNDEELCSICFSEDGQLLIWLAFYKKHSRMHVWSTGDGRQGHPSQQP